MPTKNLKDFCPGSLLEGRAEILKIFSFNQEVSQDQLEIRQGFARGLCCLLGPMVNHRLRAQWGQLFK